MKFFVRFNQNNNQVFSIYSFNETVNKIGRTFSLNLVAKSPEEGGTLATVCSDFLVENSGIDYNFNPHNTSIIIQDGQIIAMNRVYVP